MSFEEVLSLKDNEDNTPLRSAVSGGNKDAIKICLEFVSYKLNINTNKSK